jgi:hypothetical protein
MNIRKPSIKGEIVMLFTLNAISLWITIKNLNLILTLVLTFKNNNECLFF